MYEPGLTVRKVKVPSAVMVAEREGLPDEVATTLARWGASIPVMLPAISYLGGGPVFFLVED